MFVLGIFPYLFKVSENIINRILCYLCTTSLGIYIIHLFAAHMMDHYSLLGKFFVSTSGILYDSVFFVICISIGVGTTDLLSKNKITRLLLLGKE